MPEAPGDQPTLAGLAVPAARPKPSASAGVDLAATDPVARVVVDSHLPHLDRPFEYAVPADLDEVARPGVRVRVRFAGRAIDGFLLERVTDAEHTGSLAPLLKVVSPEAVLTPQIAALCRELADHYAGTMADVLRLAIPPRHARAERALPQEPVEAGEPGACAELLGGPGGAAGPLQTLGWEPYAAGAALLRRLAAGDSPRAIWTAVPDAGSPQGWPTALASAVAATHASGRGSIVVLPDHRDIDRVGAALDLMLGPGRHVRLTADQGPEQRYRDWLRVLRGQVSVVVGSRSAAFAPVRRLGLVAWWDDGDDNLQEPRAPYPHVREVLRRRAERTGSALLAGGYSRTPELQSWVQRGDLPEIRATGPALAARLPRVTVAGEGHQGARDAAAASARLPSVAWRAVHQGLTDGPVLVQVPRRGYLVSLSCEHCRTPLRCGSCAGPLRLASAGAAASCAWCGRTDDGHPCGECGGTTRRSGVVGEERTAEEVGRAFPGARVVVSRAGQVLASVPDRPAVVIATPGAEPVAETGYAATLLLDGWAVLDRGGLDSGVEALRRWLAAAALTRPGGAVVLAGVPPHGGLRPVEALVRWDPVWLAARELTDRVELGLPPVRRTATVTGETAAVVAVGEALVSQETGLEVLGPLPVTAQRGGSERQRLVVRETHGTGDPTAGLTASGGLPRALRNVRAARSLRKEPGDLEIRLDAADLDL